MTSTQTQTQTAVRYFIATWSSSSAVTTIQGIGHTADEAVADAMANAGIERESAFVAREATERFFVASKNGGVDSWTTNAAGLQDLDVDADDLAAALAEVEAGLLEGDNGHDRWTAAEAADKACDYVEFYIDENSEFHGLVVNDYEFRIALEFAVRDLVIAMIAHRDAA